MIPPKWEEGKTRYTAKGTIAAFALGLFQAWSRVMRKAMTMRQSDTGGRLLMAALDKVLSCLSCGAQIKLERKPDKSGWLKYNLDGSEHVDEKKSKNSQTQQQLAELSKQVSDLKETVNILISQIQILRSDVKLLSSKK